MIVSFGYWDLYEAYLHHTDPKPHEKRRWGLCRADNFGADMYLLTVNENSDQIRELIATAGFAQYRLLGAATYEKDKKTGEERATTWHWLVRIDIK